MSNLLAPWVVAKIKDIVSKMTGRSSLPKNNKNNPMIHKSNLVLLDEPDQLPFMECVLLEKILPQQFGLDNWTFDTFRLPNAWMKKIYYNEMYRDDEVEIIEPERETMSDYQRKTLRDYLKAKRGYARVMGPMRRSQTRPPIDELANFLGNSDSDCSDVIFVDDVKENDNSKESLLSASGSINTPTSSKSSRIELCLKHRIQPEENIVLKALEKMKNLSPEEELKYQELLKDKEYMDLLSDQAKKYVD